MNENVKFTKVGNFWIWTTPVDWAGCRWAGGFKTQADAQAAYQMIINARTLSMRDFKKVLKKISTFAN